MAGTTITENGVVSRSVDEAMHRAGLDPVTPEMLQPLRGLPKSEMFAQLAPSPVLAEQAHRHFTEILLEAVSNGQLPPKPGAAETLTALRRAGVHTCLMTGFAPAVQHALLDALGWRELVDLTLAESPALRGRPYPDLILSAALHFSLDAVQSILVAGDTTNDLLAGTRAGAGHVIGVLGGAHTRDQLESAPHTRIVTTIADIFT